jgi:hypothetical protein
MNGPDMDVRGSLPASYADKWDRLTALLVAYKVPITFAGICGAVLLLTGRAGIPSPPRWLQLVLQGFAVGIVPATFIGKVAIVDRFIPDDRRRVLELRMDEDGIKAEPWKVPRGAWDSRDRGELPALQPQHGKTDAVVTELDYLEDLENTRVEGCPEEIANPVDVLTRNGKLGEVYGELLTDRQELTRLRATIASKSVEWQGQNVNALLEAVEHGVAFEDTSMVDTLEREEWSGVDRADADDRDPERTDERRSLSELEQEANATANGQAAATDGGNDGE